VGGLSANAFVDQPELPALAYVTEVSHVLGGTQYVYASSMVANATIGIWDGLQYDTLGAGISRNGSDPLETPARGRPQVFPHSDPTYFAYSPIQTMSGAAATVGDTVVFGFRTQLYRSNGGKLVVVDGIREGSPRVVGYYDRNGIELADPTGRVAPVQPTLSAISSGA
jgi:hypothetical protein